MSARTMYVCIVTCLSHALCRVVQGSRGMRYSLISRDWIADCIEIMHEAYFAVGLIKMNVSLA